MEQRSFPYAIRFVQFETRRLVADRAFDERRRSVRSSTGKPRRYRVALLTWGAAYAVITLVLAILGPQMEGWPLVVRTLVLSLLMVGALTWVVMPVVTKLFGPWLARA
jgi:antibiotic biosynthesis monooxygenase (ABM) superfamily enzyme